MAQDILLLSEMGGVGSQVAAAMEIERDRMVYKFYLSIFYERISYYLFIIILYYLHLFVILIIKLGSRIQSVF